MLKISKHSIKNSHSLALSVSSLITSACDSEKELRSTMMTTTVFCQPKYCNRKFFLIFSARLILSCQKISLRQKIFFFWQDYPRWKKQYLINKIFNRILWMKFEIYIFAHFNRNRISDTYTHAHIHTCIHTFNCSKYRWN